MQHNLWDRGVYRESIPFSVTDLNFTRNVLFRDPNESRFSKEDELWLLFRAGVSYDDAYKLTRKQIGHICKREVEKIKGDNEFRSALFKMLAKIGGAK